MAPSPRCRVACPSNGTSKWIISCCHGKKQAVLWSKKMDKTKLFLAILLNERPNLQAFVWNLKLGRHQAGASTGRCSKSDLPSHSWRTPKSMHCNNRSAAFRGSAVNPPLENNLALPDWPIYWQHGEAENSWNELRGSSKGMPGGR